MCAASNDEIGPDDLHSDDKHIFHVERWESNDPMSESFTQSPCYITEKVSGGFLLYYAVEEIEKEFETVSYGKDGPSITEQLQSDPKTKEVEQKCSNTINEIQKKERPTVGLQSSIDFTVTLGSDQSRSAVHDGDTEHFTDVGNTHAEYDLSDRETRTDVLITPYVPHNPGSYAEISSVFKIYDSGSETATITTTTHH